MLALVIQIVASCGNLNQEPSKDFDSSIKTLTITTGMPGVGAVSNSILPSRLDCSSLTYYFAIENLINKEKSLQVFNSDNDEASLNFPIELSTGYYKISVYALASGAAASLDGKTYGQADPSGFIEDDLIGLCVLSGRATVDLRQDESIDIYLSSSGLVQTGTVSLNFYTKGWTLDTSKFYATCGIKNKAGVLVGLSDELNISGVSNVEPAADAVPLYFATINPGTYTFFVNYTSKADASVVYAWTENIMVSSNQAIKKNIALLDIIDHAPAAPSAFKASYQDFDPESVWCNVNFVWQDNAVNEAGFEIALRPVLSSEDDALITSDMAASWEAVAMDYNAVGGSFTRNGSGTTQAFDDIPGLCVDGSLNKNNSSATFKLSRGVRYLARIRSVGYSHAGNSDWLYLDISAGGTGKAGYSDFDTAARYIKVGD